jgi:single-strand DNA-binding protein
MSLNRITLIGHLGHDPELRRLPTSGRPVASFSIATDEAYTDRQGQRQQRVDWHNIVVFGKAAESCKDYLKKGREIYVEGRLRIREYEAKENGGRRQRAEIIASRVQFLGARPTEANFVTVEEPLPLADSDVPF